MVKISKGAKKVMSDFQKGLVAQIRQQQPLRNRVNKKRQRVNKKYNNMALGVAERKLSALANVDEGTPTAIAVGALAYKYYFALGSSAPPTWSGGFNALNGFTYAQGTGNNDRDGRYMFLDKSTINLSVHMNGEGSLTAPKQFRMIVFRARRVTTPTGISYDPNLRLLLKPNGDAFGAGTAGTNFNDLFLQPTNKRDWIIVADKKFTLSPFMRAGSAETTAWQGKYPNFKTMRIDLKHKIKSSFQNTSNEPEDYDYHYGVAIFAGSVGRDEVADGWEVNIRGTTTAIDS